MLLHKLAIVSVSTKFPAYFKRPIAREIFWRLKRFLSLKFEYFDPQKEKFHTHLAIIYLDDVLKLMKERIPMHERLQAARFVHDFCLT